MALNLKGVRVWVTRPSPAGEKLCKAIKDAGGEAIHYPTVEIHSVEEIGPIHSAIQQWGQQNSVIFISPQAVYHSAAFIHDYWPSLSPQPTLIAIGPGTAEALQRAHLPAHLYPEENASTEGLLALPFFQKIEDQKITVVKGEGGRETLVETLIKRGAIVTTLSVYQRTLPSSPIMLSFSKQKDIIVCTSCDILRNFFLLARAHKETIFDIPLVVISDRIYLLAKELGFKKIVLAPNASTAALLASFSGIKVRQ